ncbi:hypothetical protein LP316_15375 [Thalassotalea sp. LPB0316]|uniref:hypothetical protein n=1 Tax=Thalassotalea sp. LPB0316 TaxID=2769490 RepID=UPI0018672F23|nr:hypothetical protein [Thalassotalea sp. LPB0316]QOL25652.1 hypothetical protein LP316_15375 [Thalassotalea sp. LPB0316]
MSKPISTVVLALFMLLAFVGQGLANAAMTCEMSGNTHSSHQKAPQQSAQSAKVDHANTDHAMMMHHQTMADKTLAGKAMEHSMAPTHGDCCGDDCPCPTNACTGVSLLNSVDKAGSLALASELIVSSKTQHTNFVISALFRPPIIA